MAIAVVNAKREVLKACLTCSICKKLLKDATTISECLHTCKSTHGYFFFPSLPPPVDWVPCSVMLFLRACCFFRFRRRILGKSDLLLLFITVLSHTHTPSRRFRRSASSDSRRRFRLLPSPPPPPWFLGTMIYLMVDYLQLLFCYLEPYFDHQFLPLFMRAIFH